MYQTGSLLCQAIIYYIYTTLCLSVCLSVCLYINVCTYVCMYVCKYVRMYACMLSMWVLLVFLHTHVRITFDNMGHLHCS